VNTRAAAASRNTGNRGGDGPLTWQPSATLETLRQRAALLDTIRAFFRARGVLEVDTPLLCSSGITDPSIEPLTVGGAQSVPGLRYLQTSPEYAMKRLLAAHGEPIFQVAKAFRDGEAGARHNPEFTLLEWYRPGFELHQLMDEVAQLVTACLGDIPVTKASYRQLFLEELALDPFGASEDDLARCARDQIDTGDIEGDRDLWLDLLMSHLIEPRLADRGLYFVHDYPASQAALSRIVEQDGVLVGQRFELYVNGVELANGYRELTDPEEQRRRFEADNEKRRTNGQPQRPIDENLLAAMTHGLPQCSGVALGVDRLIMLALGKNDIREVVSFHWEKS
jgi:lysyl-tRNA synthetase class 2